VFASSKKSLQGFIRFSRDLTRIQILKINDSSSASTNCLFCLALRATEEVIFGAMVVLGPCIERSESYGVKLADEEVHNVLG